MSIGEGMIFEGLAEHFRETMIGGSQAPWLDKISEEQARKLFNEIKSEINNKSTDFYNEVFFGTGRYPQWAGYTIGYYLIKDYLEMQGKINWNKILRINPKEVLNSLKIF